MANPALRPRFLAPGDRLGKFDLIRQIAVGGMAELYLARTMGIEGFEKLVVVKRILPQFAESQSFVTMFLNEARLSATLHHPNITQVYDIGVEDGDYFFSMEYVHGEDLGRTVVTATENGVPLSLDAALTVVVGLCAGLHYAHEKAGPDGTPLNVVHRDVSPSNVLVSYDGAVKLVDFGIARAGSQPAQTRGGLKGKIAYMSPEQCRGKTALDRRSDVFSIGTILYELTTGQLPFTDETEYGVLNQIVNNDVAAPSTIVPNYPPALEAIVMKALARDVEQRYKSALELQGQLEDFAHENRLRVSPLVLARLMSTLFPARLEEWDHARAQGAFFVEQHVVRTLIESGKTSDNTNVAGALLAALVAPVAPVAPSSDEETTAVTTVVTMSDTAVGPPPVSPLHESGPSSAAERFTGTHATESDPAARQTISGPPPVLQQRPTPAPSRAATPPPIRAVTPAPGRAATPAPVRAPTPAPIAAAPIAATPVPPEDEATRPSTAPRHTPQARAATPSPGSVPMFGQGSQAMSSAPGAAMPAGGGVLVSNQSAVPDATPVAGSPSIDVTERVRVPSTVEVMARATPRRSRLPFVFAGIAAIALAAAITIVATGGSSSKPAVGSAEPASEPGTRASGAAEPVAAEPVAAEPVAAEPVAAEPVVAPTKRVAEPVAAEPVVAPTKRVAEPVAAEPVVAPTKRVAEPTPAVVDAPVKSTPRTVDKRLKPAPKIKPGKKPDKKPEITTPKVEPKPKKEPAWNDDSPFMPVRTDKR